MRFGFLSRNDDLNQNEIKEYKQNFYIHLRYILKEREREGDAREDEAKRKIKRFQ